MDSNNIDAFLAIVDEQSVSRAAERMYLSQSTVSHRLKRLEAYVNCELIDRAQGQRDSILTAQGEAFLPLARRWVQLSNEIAAFKSRPLTSNVSVGCNDYLLHYFFADVFNNILNDSRKIVLTIYTNATQTLYAQMINSQIDIAFSSELIRHKSIVTVPLFSDHRVLVCNPGRYHEGKLHPSELDYSDEIVGNWSMQEMHLWHDQWRSPDVEPFVHVNSLMAMPLFLKNPRAWVLVTQTMARQLQTRMPLEVHELFSPPPATICYKMTPRYMHPDRAEGVNLFCRFLDNYLEDIDWLEKAF